MTHHHWSRTLLINANLQLTDPYHFQFCQTEIADTLWNMWTLHPLNWDQILWWVDCWESMRAQQSGHPTCRPNWDGQNSLFLSRFKQSFLELRNISSCHQRNIADKDWIIPALLLGNVGLRNHFFPQKETITPGIAAWNTLGILPVLSAASQNMEAFAGRMEHLAKRLKWNSLQMEQRPTARSEVCKCSLSVLPKRSTADQQQCIYRGFLMWTGGKYSPFF